MSQQEHINLATIDACPSDSNRSLLLLMSEENEEQQEAEQVITITVAIVVPSFESTQER